jgi:hypothetical protein
MKQSLLWLLLSSSLLASAQSDSASNSLWYTLAALSRQGRVDSVFITPQFFKDTFHRFDTPTIFYRYQDTIAFPAGFIGFGYSIFNPFSDYTSHYLGRWTFYYPNGRLFSTGDYISGAYTCCDYDGPRIARYSYKAGHWQYWYDNGTPLAEGTYQLVKHPVPTNCGMDTVYASVAGPGWTFYDRSGRIVPGSDSLVTTLSCVGEGCQGVGGR